MFEQNPTEQIREAVDARLSSLQGDPWLAQRVLANAKGEQKVKKKISVGFVLVLVLVLAAVTALAAMTLTTFYERAIELEGKSGLIRDWSAADKMALVDWMVEAGADLDEKQVGRLHDDALSDDDKGKLAIEIMYAYYEKEYGLKREDYNESKMAISFSEGTWDDGSGSKRPKTWSMDLWLKADSEHPMGISILPDGAVKQASAPHISDWNDEWNDDMRAKNIWTIEGMAALQNKWGDKAQTLLATGAIDTKGQISTVLSRKFGLPSEDSLARTRALEAAETAVLQMPGWSKEKLALFRTKIVKG